MGALIRLEGVTKDYGSHRALDDVSVTVGSGVTGLLGPNGAGKTTLIKVILGLVRVTRGSGQLLSLSLGRQARAIRAKVGFMPEDDCYLPGLTGVESVQFTARLSRLPAIEALRRAHEMLDFCGIEQERYRNVETYSTGMRQKLKFAQAIVHDPPILILDEPTAGLDPEEREAMLQRIQVLARRAGKAVLISTHILPDVQTVSDAVIILAKGRVRISERLEVLQRPASQAYHVRVFGKTEKLAERIRYEGMDVRVGANRSLTVIADSPDLVRNMWDWARECGVGLRSLRPARNSLEQIFVEAVTENSSAGS